MKTRDEWLVKCERRYAVHPTLGMRFRSMLGSESMRYDYSPYDTTKTGIKSNPEKLEEQEARLIVMTACDDAGRLLFKPDDVRSLMGALDAATMKSLYRFAVAHCGLDSEEKPLEDLGKNSGSTSSDAPP